jgi:hypothetical protein
MVPVRMRSRTTGVESISFGRPIYWMVKVLLAIFVGLFRARVPEPSPESVARIAEEALG